MTNVQEPLAPNVRYAYKKMFIQLNKEFVALAEHASHDYMSKVT